MTEITRARIAKLSPSQRHFLIDHIDGAVPVDRSDRFVAKTRQTLLRSKLLMPVPHGTCRPRSTALTEAGRIAVAYVLGEAADMLARAGLVDEERPIDVLRRLKASKRAEQARNAAETDPAEVHNLLDF